MGKGQSAHLYCYLINHLFSRKWPKDFGTIEFHVLIKYPIEKNIIFSYLLLLENGVSFSTAFCLSSSYIITTCNQHCIYRVCVSWSSYSPPHLQHTIKDMKRIIRTISRMTTRSNIILFQEVQSLWISKIKAQYHACSWKQIDKTLETKNCYRKETRLKNKNHAWWSWWWRRRWPPPQSMHCSYCSKKC